VPAVTYLAVPGRVATIYDVARLAGVSHQTVSRVLNGEAGIRPATRERVEATIESLGYRRNPAAVSLASRRSHRIGALVSGLLEGGPSKFIDGASTAARDAGFALDIVSLTVGDDQVVSEAVLLLEQQDLAGILAFSPSDRVRDLLMGMQFRVPVVVSTAPEDDTAADGRQAGNATATRLALEHLFSLDHRQVVMVSGPREWASAAMRTAAYQTTMIEHGLAALPVIEGDWTARSGYEAGWRIPLDTGVTAVLVANDQMALGVLRALSERGVRVPEQMSVVGFDDIPESGYYQPPLTTVRLDFTGYGRESITTLLRTIEPHTPHPALTPEPPRLVVRGSTQPARASAWRSPPAP
jgi:DNA-binding LacI/PurR family transcriptional regulator